MPGIINKRLQALKSVYLRALLFNNDARVYFYSTLREYVKSHFPLPQIFNHIQQQDNNPAMKEIAKLSKKAIRNNQPFAVHYYQSGLFTEHESNLLVLGERHDCLETITTLLLSQEDSAPPLVQILSAGAQWILMTLVITAMAIYTLPYLQDFTTGYQWFFDYVTFVQAWWLELTGVLGGALLLYYWCLYHLTGPLRGILTTVGCFRLHAMLIERQFLKISSALMETKLPPNEFLQLMENTFGRNKLFKQNLQKGRMKLKEASLLQILKEVLSPHAYNHVLSCTPNQTPDEIARGFSAAERMLQIRLKKTIKTYQIFYTLLFLSTSAGITIPFAFVSMGMGIRL